MKKNSLPNLTIVVGTALQRRITEKLMPSIYHSSHLCDPVVLSLEGYYRFGLKMDSSWYVFSVKSVIAKPWYDRSKIVKLVSLIQFVLQISLLSRRHRRFLFFVDTGLLERTAIFIFRWLGCKTAVLQDGIKRRPKKYNPNGLTWFGGGRADLYLLTGERFVPMVRCGRAEVVGSPIYDNRVKPRREGKKILFINQCFARYGETTEPIEVEFVRRVVEVVSCYGHVEVRLHPHNRVAAYDELKSDDVDVTFEKPLSHSLADAGIALCVNSTVIMEAIASGIPVLTMNWHPSPYVQPVRAGVIACKNLSDLRKKMALWKEGLLVFYESPDDIANEVRSLIAYSGNDSIKRAIRALERFVERP